MEINLNERTYLPECPLEQLAPDPRNCRANLGSNEELEELAESIQAVGGLIEPIIARPRPDWVPADHFPEATLLIVSGHRRRVGCDMAGMSTARVHVWPDLDDAQATKIQLMENLHRKDISPIDEAVALRRLMDELGYTTVDCSIAIGKTTQHVRNRIRLLDLPETVQIGIAQGSVSLSVANQLIQLPQPVIDRIVADNALKDVASMRTHMQYHCMRHMANAAFSLSETYSDAQGELIPCDQCQHRGAHCELFGDESPDCPDAACFDRKQKVYYKQLNKAHKRQATTSVSASVSTNQANAELSRKISTAEDNAMFSVYLSSILDFFDSDEGQAELINAHLYSFSFNFFEVNDVRIEMSNTHGIEFTPSRHYLEAVSEDLLELDIPQVKKLLGLMCYTIPDYERDLEKICARFGIAVDKKAIKAAKKAAKTKVEKEHEHAIKAVAPTRRGKPVKEEK